MDINAKKVFLFDMDGTIYMGDTPIDGAMDALQRLRDNGKEIYFLTNNSSKSVKEYQLKLKKMGYSAEESRFLSSTKATIMYLQKHFYGSKVFAVGNTSFRSTLTDAGIILVDSEQADLVVLAYDTEIDYAKILIGANLMLNGKPYIATHPDKVCPSDRGDLPDVGAFIEMFSVATGRLPDVIIGKPYKPMADYVMSLINCPKEDVVMVGDRLYTDIAFGKDNGFSSILVLSGETNSQIYAQSAIKADWVKNSISEI